MRRKGSRKKEASRLDVKVDLRLTPEDFEKLEKMRREMGWTRSELARWAIREMSEKALALIPIPEGTRLIRVYPRAKSRKIVFEFV